MPNINPVITTTAAGTFNVQSSGYIAGTFLDDPALRNELAGGISNVATPIWGGMLISESTTPLGTATNLPERSLGGYITLATNLTAAAANQATGFSVFNQAHNMLITPQSSVPTSQQGMMVNFLRFGCGMRIVVPMAASLVSLEGNVITQQVSWNYVDQLLVPYAPAYAVVTITNAVWASTGGGQVTFTVGTDLSAVLVAGDIIDVSGVVNTGGASTGAFNGQWVVKATPGSTTVVVIALAAATIGTYASGGTIAAGGGALPCKVLDVNIGNSMVPVYNATTGNVTWLYTGSTAVLLI